MPELLNGSSGEESAAKIALENQPPEKPENTVDKDTKIKIEGLNKNLIRTAKYISSKSIFKGYIKNKEFFYSVKSEIRRLIQKTTGNVKIISSPKGFELFGVAAIEILDEHCATQIQTNLDQETINIFDLSGAIDKLAIELPIFSKNLPEVRADLFSELIIIRNSSIENINLKILNNAINIIILQIIEGTEGQYSDHQENLCIDVHNNIKNILDKSILSTYGKELCLNSIHDATELFNKIIVKEYSVEELINKINTPNGREFLSIAKKIVYGPHLISNKIPNNLSPSHISCLFLISHFKNLTPHQLMEIGDILAKETSKLLGHDENHKNCHAITDKILSELDIVIYLKEDKSYDIYHRNYSSGYLQEYFRDNFPLLRDRYFNCLRNNLALGHASDNFAFEYINHESSNILLISAQNEPEILEENLRRIVYGYSKNLTGENFFQDKLVTEKIFNRIIRRAPKLLSEMTRKCPNESKEKIISAAINSWCSALTFESDVINSNYSAIELIKLFLTIYSIYPGELSVSNLNLLQGETDQQNMWRDIFFDQLNASISPEELESDRRQQAFVSDFSRKSDFSIYFILDLFITGKIFTSLQEPLETISIKALYGHSIAYMYGNMWHNTPIWHSISIKNRFWSEPINPIDIDFIKLILKTDFSQFFASVYTNNNRYVMHILDAITGCSRFSREEVSSVVFMLLWMTRQDKYKDPFELIANLFSTIAIMGTTHSIDSNKKITFVFSPQLRKWLGTPCNGTSLSPAQHILKQTDLCLDLNDDWKQLQGQIMRNQHTDKNAIIEIIKDRRDALLNFRSALKEIALAK